jgi:hypothetical protein
MLINSLDSAIENQDIDGILLSSLPSNTIIVVKTKSSNYEITYTSPLQIFIKGGTLPNSGIRYPEPVEIEVLGSSWGGSMLKLDWIGKNMCLNFIDKTNNKTVVTSLIQDLFLK